MLVNIEGGGGGGGGSVNMEKINKKYHDIYESFKVHVLCDPTLVRHPFLD